MSSKVVFTEPLIIENKIKHETLTISPTFLDLNKPLINWF